VIVSHSRDTGTVLLRHSRESGNPSAAGKFPAIAASKDR